MVSATIHVAVGPHATAKRRLLDSAPASFPLLAARGDTPARRRAPMCPAHPIEARHAVFEAYVVEVHVAAGLPRPKFGCAAHARATGRSQSGRFTDRIAPASRSEAHKSGRPPLPVSASNGSHVLVASTGGAFEIVEPLPKRKSFPRTVRRAGIVTGEPRRSLRPSLKNASLRGKSTPASAGVARACTPGRHERCEISARRHLRR